MKRSPSPSAHVASLALVAALSLACGAPAPEPDPVPAPEDPGAGGDRYTVRGLVVELQDRGSARRALRIRHEAIPDFKGPDGEVWEGGMESMTMRFATAEGVALDGIAAGDKVEFVLVVDWENTPTQWIVELVELPAETELDLGPEAEQP
jgi:hypothetical protein